MKFRCLICLLLYGIFLNACTPNGIYHTVQPGQTLYRIAQAYDINEQELAQVNQISDPTKLKVGQRLYVPGVSHPRQVPPTSRATSDSTPGSINKAELTEKISPPSTSTSQKSDQSTVKPKPPSKSQKAVVGVFIWPIKGKILRGFDSAGAGGQKGIEIQAAAGSPVVAAAPGKVIYSGNAIRGYGNLIILEHSDNYFTVYGYNEKNLVAMNDYVGQGDKIALTGTPPNNKSPRLHFEIRQGKVPLNPIFYLP